MKERASSCRHCTRQYRFIPFKQERDSIGRLITPHKKDIAREEHFWPPPNQKIDYSNFIFQPFQHRQPNQSPEKVRVVQVIPPKKQQMTRRPRSSAPILSRYTPKQLLKQQQSPKRFYEPLVIDNHVRKSGFVRDDAGRKNITVAREKEPVIDQNSIKQDMPRILRLESVQIRDMPENMHERWKVLVGRVEQTKKNIELMDIWAVKRYKD